MRVDPTFALYERREVTHEQDALAAVRSAYNELARQVAAHKRQPVLVEVTVRFAPAD